MTALDAILATAATHPDLVAIEQHERHAVTYRELLARARAFADLLDGDARRADAQLPRPRIVELPAARSADFIASCLGAWLAGHAWIPIDPGEPAPRREAILSKLAAWTTSLAAPGDAGPGPAELAYAIATSGSTGTPKVVLVSHRGLAPLLRAQIAAFELAPGARALWLHAPVFDASLSDWGTALASGATLVVPSGGALASPGRLRAELVDRAISHVDLPPALLAYLPAHDPPPSLRVVILGGEACPVHQVRSLARRVRVVVVYGPTETTVCSSLSVVAAERWSRPSIGAPIAGTRFDVVDGELWIAGDGVALGYAGDVDATARNFVVRDGERWYRTGDRVEASAEGLVFVGRIDRQRKTGGRRVDLDDIEASVRLAPGVREAAVVAIGDRLVAFVEGNGEPAAVRAWLRGRVAPWMMPRRIVVVASLPRTATGKLDRAVLAAAGDARPVAPPTGDPLRDALALLWCETIGVAEAIADDTFLGAGGDSLAALALHVAAEDRGFHIAGLLDGDPTFAELVERVRRGAATGPLTVERCEARALASLRLPSPSSLRPRSGRGVVITGAAGQLGRELAKAWRAREPERRLIALVRAPDQAAARLRCPLEIDEVIACDLGAQRFGMEPAAWDALTARVSTVVHAAATVRLGHTWDGHAMDVAAAVEVAVFARAAEAHLHHVSTLSIFANTSGARGRHEETARPDGSWLVHGGYAQTKVGAEAIARHSGATTIFRLGLLAGKRHRATDQLQMTIRGLARLGVAPAACDVRFDLTDLTYAARAMVALALRAENHRPPEVHHVASPHGATLDELVSVMRTAGVALRTEPADRWLAAARARLGGDADVAMAQAALGRVLDAQRPDLDLFLATDADFAVERTAALLAEAGVVAPPASTTLAAVVAAALEDS